MKRYRVLKGRVHRHDTGEVFAADLSEGQERALVTAGLLAVLGDDTQPSGTGHVAPDAPIVADDGSVTEPPQADENEETR